MSARIHGELLQTASELSPKLVDALTEAGPLRLKRRSKTPPLDFLCRAVAGQQLSVKAAQTIWGRVVESTEGEPLCDYLAEARHESLRECGLSASKCKAMHAIAEASRAGELDVDVLRRLDHSDRARRLTAIWGVGQWTADMMGIFYFGDADIWPEGDITARKTLERLTSRRRKTLRTAERFAPHRSYLAMHMWRYANAKPT